MYIEDDDTREDAWQQEKEKRKRQGLHTNMAEYKQRKLFFESNEFLSQPLQILLMKKDLLGKLNEDEESKLKLQVLQLKVELKQEKHPNLCKRTLGDQLRILHKLKENKDELKEMGIWEDDLTRELQMIQEEEFLKQAIEKVQKQVQDGDVGLFSFLRESTVTVEEIEDSQL